MDYAGGLTGPMTTNEFIDLVKGSAVREDLHVSLFNAGSRMAPKLTCTMTKGSWDDGDSRNIPRPMVPEFTVHEPGSRRIVHRGWRGLLWIMIGDGWVKPTNEIRKVVGQSEFDKRYRKAWKGCY